MSAPDNMVEAAKSAARQLARQRRDSFAASADRHLVEAALVRPVADLVRHIIDSDLSGPAGAACAPGDLVPGDLVIAGYWPLGSELDPRPVLVHLHNLGIRVALPVSGPRGTALTFRQWHPDAAMVTGRFGIHEPADGNPVLVPTVVLVPLLAFDRQGGRLGYGAGYYDRTLDALRAGSPGVAVRAIGLAFAVQELDQVPLGQYDQPLDWIVTDAGVMAFPAGPCN